MDTVRSAARPSLAPGPPLWERIERGPALPTGLLFLGVSLPLWLLLPLSAAIAISLFLPVPALAQWRHNGVPVAPSGPQQTPQVASDGAGGLYVVWADYRDYETSNHDVYLQRITADGLVAPGWPALGLLVAGGPDYQAGGLVRPDGSGGALVAWTEQTATSPLDINLQRILADGSIAPGWPARGVPVTVHPAHEFLSDVVSDGSGGAYLAWTDFRDGSFDLNEAQVYVSRITGDGNLAGGWTPNGNRLVERPESRGNPYLLVDPSGDVLIAWGESQIASTVKVTSPVTRWTWGASAVELNFHVTRWTPSGAVAAGWPAEGVPLLQGHTGRGGARIVSDGTGGAFVGWRDNRRGGPGDTWWLFDLYAQHIGGDGTVDPRWPSNGLAVCDAPGGQTFFTMAADGSGGALFAWEDLRGDYFKIFAQRVRADATLAPGWTPNGVLLSSTSQESQIEPYAVADGTGGLYAIWTQFPNDRYEIAGQHVLAGGQIADGWPEEGLTIAGGDCSCTSPRATSDGRGGVVMAFDFTTFDNSLIHAHRIAADGPVATLLTLLDAETFVHGVTLRWHSAEAGRLRSFVERRAAEEWAVLDSPLLVGTDVLSFTDTGLAPGRYEYRLRYFDGAFERVSDAVEVEIASTQRLDLAGFRPNPAVGRAFLAFSLPDDRPARLDLINVRGRVVQSREVGKLGGGSHVISLDEKVEPGIYWVRLRHPERTMVTRGLFVR